MAHIGRRNTLGIALEETAGTALEPTMYVPFLECSLQERHTPIADTQAKGLRDAEGGSSALGKQWGEGNIEVVLDPRTSPYWFALALGSISSAGTVGNYTHTITQSQDNDPLTATIWRDRTVDEVQFTNSVAGITTLSFSDDVASLSTSIQSKFPTSQARTATQEALSYYTFRNATVAVAGGTAKVTDFSLEISNDPEMVWSPGDNDVDRIIWKAFRVTGSFTLIFEDEDQKDAFSDLTKQTLTVTFAGSGTDEIVITIPRVRVDTWEEGSANDDISKETISFVAERGDTEDETIKIEVTNDVEDYTDES